MKKAWRVILSVALIIILLGGVFIGVGFITGADTERMYSILDTRYNLTEWADYFAEVWNLVWSVFNPMADSADALVMSAA